MKPIIEVQEISKNYKINHERGMGYLSLRDSLSRLFSRKKTNQETFWALKDISFNIYPGDSIGIIGRNGAGKSTLLKILSKITLPSSGKIVSRGRIASLLEVGTGFHPELTGRENIFLNGSILGLKKSEIIRQFDNIVDFSGVEKFLDTPLKQYSSGMQLRLAFAVAAHLEPEILIIDEVLAVGDAEFQKKCLGKMDEVSKSGRTILFVSHNMSAVENLCNKGVLLEKGKLLKEGGVTEIVRDYQKIFTEQIKDKWEAIAPSSSGPYFKRIAIELHGSQPNYKLIVKCDIHSSSQHKDAFVAFDIANSIGVPIIQTIPTLKPFIKHSENEKLYSFEIDLPPLIPDMYSISAWLGSHNTETFVWEKNIIGFEICDSPTPGRSFPHSHNNGFIIPNSRLISIE